MCEYLIRFIFLIRIVACTSFSKRLQLRGAGASYRVQQWIFIVNFLFMGPLKKSSDAGWEGRHLMRIIMVFKLWIIAILLALKNNKMMIRKGEAYKKYKNRWDSKTRRKRQKAIYMYKHKMIKRYLQTYSTKIQTDSVRKEAGQKDKTPPLKKIKAAHIPGEGCQRLTIDGAGGCSSGGSSAATRHQGLC